MRVHNAALDLALGVRELARTRQPHLSMMMQSTRPPPLGEGEPRDEVIDAWSRNPLLDEATTGAFGQNAGTRIIICLLRPPVFPRAW